jgi:membrane peptidoglycan carboxypeptidase
MVSLDFISRDQANDASQTDPLIQPTMERMGLSRRTAVYARRQAEQLLNAQGLDGSRLVLQGGLRVYTTLDLNLHTRPNV